MTALLSSDFTVLGGAEVGLAHSRGRLEEGERQVCCFAGNVTLFADTTRSLLLIGAVQGCPRCQCRSVFASTQCVGW